MLAVYLLTGGALFSGKFNKTTAAVFTAGLVAIGMSLLFWRDAYSEAINLLSDRVAKEIIETSSDDTPTMENSSISNTVGDSTIKPTPAVETDSRIALRRQEQIPYTCIERMPFEVPITVGLDDCLFTFDAERNFRFNNEFLDPRSDNEVEKELSLSERIRSDFEVGHYSLVIHDTVKRGIVFTLGYLDWTLGPYYIEPKSMMFGAMSCNAYWNGYVLGATSSLRHIILVDRSEDGFVLCGLDTNTNEPIQSLWRTISDTRRIESFSNFNYGDTSKFSFTIDFENGSRDRFFFRVENGAFVENFP